MQSGKPDRVSEAEEQRCKYSGSIKCCMKVVCSDKEGIAVRKDYKLVFKLENAVDSKPEQRKIKEDFPLWMKVEFEHNHAIGSKF